MSSGVKAFQPMLIVSSSSSYSPKFFPHPSLPLQPHSLPTLTFSNKALFGFGAKSISTKISNIRCFSGWNFCDVFASLSFMSLTLSVCVYAFARTINFSALTPELKSTLDKVVTSHKVVLFMKGSKDFPQCGFSNTVVQILKSLNVPFETINILENEILRQGLKEYSSWPTFPQLYIDGEFFGGCDITVEAYQSGQLHEVLEKAMCS